MSYDTLRFTCLACGEASTPLAGMMPDEQLVATDMQEGDRITVSCGQCTHPTTMTAHLLQDGTWAEIQRQSPKASTLRSREEATEQTDALMDKMGAGDFQASSLASAGLMPHAMLEEGIRWHQPPKGEEASTADVVESTTEDHAEQVKGD